MITPDRHLEKVTLEDLLSLKRAERPSPEFWTRFERELRDKQLAAIVEKRPWWHAPRVSQAARVIARFQVPAGAAAILALTFIAANHYQGRPATTPPASEETASHAALRASPIAARTPRLEQSAEVARVAGSEAPSVISLQKADMSAAPERSSRVAVNESMADAQSTTDLTAMIPWGLSQADADVAATPASVSTRLLQTGLQLASTSDAGVTSLLGNALAGDTVSAARQSQMEDAKPAATPSTSPRELRRAKILAGLTLADNSEGSDYTRVAHGRDVAANDLSDEQLYDSARRLGVGGDRFTLKF